MADTKTKNDIKFGPLLIKKFSLSDRVAHRFEPSGMDLMGVIHTDFKKGFICAEVYSYDSIKEFGSEAAVKENGKLRREGKDYHPKDGDIMFFRFNV